MIESLKRFIVAFTMTLFAIFICFGIIYLIYYYSVKVPSVKLTIMSVIMLAGYLPFPSYIIKEMVKESFENKNA